MDLRENWLEITVYVVEATGEQTGEATIALPQAGYEWDVTLYMLGRELSRFLQAIRTANRHAPAVMIELFPTCYPSPFDGRKPWEETGQNRELFPLLQWYQSEPIGETK